MGFYLEHGNYFFAHVMADNCRPPTYKISNFQIANVLPLLNRKMTTVAGFFTGNTANILPVLPEFVKKHLTLADDKIPKSQPIEGKKEISEE